MTLSAAAIFLALVGLVPVLTMVARSFFVAGRFSVKAYVGLWGSGTQLLGLAGHSVLLAFLVTSLVIVVGVPLGVLLGKSDLPLRRTLTTLIGVPFLLPPYVIAVAWFAVLGKRGLLGRALASTTAEYISSAFFGLPGCVAVLFIAFLPVVVVITIAHLSTVNPRLEEAGRLVSPWPGVLARITLPLIAPAILFAAVLVFLLTLGDIGVPAYLRYPVYPLETLTQLSAFYDFSAATASSVPLLAVTLAVLALERSMPPNRMRELRAAFGRRRAQIPLGPWRLPLFGLVSAWVAASILVPFAALIAQSFSVGSYSEAFARAGESILRSTLFAAIGATLLAVLGFFCGYLVRSRALPVWRGVDALGLFLFTLPGTVIGTGLITLWNSPRTNFIYQTPAIILLGYVAQYSLIPTRMTAAILERIPPSLEQVTRLGGASWFETLWKIVVPLASRGLVTVWMVTYVFCLRDLGISMVVYPPGSDTLPVRIMTLMANGAPGLIAALCVMLVTVTLVPLGGVVLWSARGAWRA